MIAFRLLDAGDSALVLRLGERIDSAANARVLHIARRVRDLSLPAVRDVVPAFSSLTVYFDAMAIEREDVKRMLTRAARDAEGALPAAGRRMAIPVRYGGTDGPDLAEVAAFARCSQEEVIRLHLSREYRVYMLGFLPGFPYMALVDERIAMPRRESPRVKVPAGSVGIAGRQTGVYPVASPGGWRLIGRTDAVMFDPDRSQPALLQPGDTVRFTRM